jgi:uncharacterized ubiquitin-like protein YukD
MGEENVDQRAVAQTVSEGIHYAFLDNFLVKLCEPVMVKKEFNTPVEKSETDDDGLTVKDYEDVATEVKEVESDFKRGIVLKVPTKYQEWMNDEKIHTYPINVGDTIIFRAGAITYFDMFKDSAMVAPYNVIAVEIDD